MSRDHAAFTGEIPENYDRYLGPVALVPYAEELVRRVSLANGGSLLELACGTGIVTRRLRDRLPSTVSIVATDLNEAMMNYAKQKFRANENVVWKQADATDLPFADQSFDSIVCQFGVMFFPDKARAFAEAYRVLKPGGVFLFDVWDAMEEHELGHIAHTIIGNFFENNPPDFYQVPFSFHDPKAIHSLLTTSGFQDVDIEIVPLTTKVNSARDVTRGLVYGNPIINDIRAQVERRLPEIEDAIAAAITRRCGDHPVTAKMRALFCSGTTPQPG